MRQDTQTAPPLFLFIMSLLGTKSVYLAGSMSGQKNYGRAWRKGFQKWLEERKVAVFNPCQYESGILKKYGVRADLCKWESLPIQMQLEIIQRDLKQIAESTKFVVCYYTKPSSGTTKEMVHAWMHKIPLYVVSKRRIRGWEGSVVQADNSKVFDDFIGLKNFLAYKFKLRKYKRAVSRK